MESLGRNAVTDDGCFDWGSLHNWKLIKNRQLVCFQTTPLLGKEGWIPFAKQTEDGVVSYYFTTPHSSCFAVLGAPPILGGELFYYFSLLPVP
jgi:hypothetical protein